jgi:hypothetical protein
MILELIQRMAPEGSPLIALAQHGAEAANLVVAERSADNPPREPSIGNKDQARWDRVEAVSWVSGNHRLADNDAQCRITQNHNIWEYGRDRDDLRNVIEDRRRVRARAQTPKRWSLAGDFAIVGRSGFRALAGPLIAVHWPDKFKAGHIDRYDGSSNHEELIQVYQIVIEAAGGDDQVKANFLPTALINATRSWLTNLPEGSIYTWDRLCAMFIENFQGMYERPSTAETMKTIKQKHDESLRDYIKCFCKVRNAITYIQDIEIINTFHDEVSDIETVEAITLKKPKTVADLLTVADVRIEASEARVWLLESRGKGPSKKKEDWEVNTVDRRDHEDRGYCGKQSSDQKEKRSFQRPNDVEKWCEIHRTAGHDLEECKTFLNRKKMPPPAAPAPQEARRWRGVKHNNFGGCGGD